MGPFKVEKILIYWLKNLLCAPGLVPGRRERRRRSNALPSHPPQQRIWPRVCPRQILCEPGSGAVCAQDPWPQHPGGPDRHQKNRPCRAAQPRPPRDESRHRRASGSQYRRLRSDLRGPGHDPQTEKLAAEQRCGKAVCPGRSAG